jgi:hypothetical protein
MDGWVDKLVVGRWVDGQIVGWRDTWIDKWTGRKKDRRMDVRTDRQRVKETSAITNLFPTHLL